MAREDLAERFPKDSTVQCRVLRVEPFGAIVEIEGEPPAHGLIRPAEWDWGRLLDLMQVARSGERLKAVVTGHGRPERSEQLVYLSRRLTHPDPFLQFRKGSKIGQTVRGQVQFVTQQGGGVLVALENGVDGFVPRSELPGLALDQEPVGFGLLPRDWIEAEIIGFSEENPAAGHRGEVRLSIRSRLIRRDRDRKAKTSQDTSLLAHPKAGPVLQNIALDHQLREIELPEVPAEVRDRFRRILVVENNPAVSESLDAALGLLGFECSRANNSEEAQAALSARAFDLVVLDFNLTRENGFEILSRIASAAGSPEILFLTGAQERDWAAVREHAQQVAGIFQKPASLQRLIEAMHDLALDQPVHDDRALVGDFGRGADLMGSLSHSPLGSEQTDFAAVVEQVRSETAADRAVLLRYQAGPKFEALAGTWNGISPDRYQDIDLSPMGNVLREGSSAFVPDAARTPNRFRHLPDKGHVGSFAGHRLGYRDQWTYGLFVSSVKSNQLDPSTPALLERAAQRLEKALLERHLQSVLTESQGLLLTGALANSLLHEVKNAAQALGPYSMVQSLLFDRHEGDLGKLTTVELVQLKKSVKGIHEISEELRGLVALFRDLVAGGQQEEIGLRGALQRLHSILKPLADPHKVALEEPTFETEVPPLRLSPKLLDQPLLNVMLNAVEQISLSGSLVRVVQVTVGFDADSRFPVRIDVHDTGPGIHSVHREQIFEPFYSTKDRGTGLGLPISRLFIERLGGRLYLLESSMFVGSTFRIVLPKEVLA